MGDWARVNWGAATTNFRLLENGKTGKKKKKGTRDFEADLVNLKVRLLVKHTKAIKAKWISDVEQDAIIGFFNPGRQQRDGIEAKSKVQAFSLCLRWSNDVPLLEFIDTALDEMIESGKETNK